MLSLVGAAGGQLVTEAASSEASSSGPKGPTGVRGGESGDSNSGCLLESGIESGTFCEDSPPSADTDRFTSKDRKSVV